MHHVANRITVGVTEHQKPQASFVGVVANSAEKDAQVGLDGRASAALAFPSRNGPHRNVAHVGHVLLGAYFFAKVLKLSGRHVVDQTPRIGGCSNHDVIMAIADAG